MNAIIKAKNKACLEPLFESAGYYHVKFENHFTILSDNNTIVGVDSEEQNLLMMEDITDEITHTCIGTHQEQIKTISINESRDRIIIGEHDGHATQYQMTDGYWSIEKEYGYIQVGKIMSSTIFGNLAVIGGNKNKIRLIDLKKKEFVEKPIETAIELVYSPHLCLDSRSVILTVGGLTPNYSKNKSDLFDVTNAYEENDLFDLIEKYPDSSVGSTLQSRNLKTHSTHNQKNTNQGKLFNQQLTQYKDRLKKQKDQFQDEIDKKNKKIDKLKVKARYFRLTNRNKRMTKTEKSKI